MLVAGEAVENALACFEHAIQIAQKQQAKSWELRATLSLARCWVELSKATEARDRLQRVYEWFTEGFDRPDLLRAKELLTELSSVQHQ